MFPSRLLCLFSIYFILSASKVVNRQDLKSQTPYADKEYNDLLDELEAEREYEIEPSKFARLARIPMDFSFNSDLTLLRKMLSENRPREHRLLAFGK